VDGFGTCYTMKILRKAMNSIIPGATLRLVGYSDDILPIQAKFENKKGQATCTESVTSKRFINQQIYCI
jgi:hypothetical protein